MSSTRSSLPFVLGPREGRIVVYGFLVALVLLTAIAAVVGQVLVALAALGSARSVVHRILDPSGQGRFLELASKVESAVPQQLREPP